MAQRGGRGWNPEARAERLFATLACVERVNSSKADADDARLGREPINLQGVRLARVRYAPMFGAFRHVFASRHRSTVSEMTCSDCSAPSNTPFSKSSSM